MNEYYARIGHEVHLLEEYCRRDVDRYRFTAVGSTIAELTDGDGSISIDGISYDVHAPCLIAYLDGQLVAPHVRNSRGREVVFSNHFTDEVCHAALDRRDVHASVAREPVIGLDGPLSRSVDILIDGLEDIASRDDGGRGVMSAVHLAISFLLGPIYIRFLPCENSSAARTAGKFNALLDQEGGKYHNLGFYADKLGVSVRYLDKCVDRIEHKTPGRLLEETLEKEAEKFLENTERSVVRISEELGFSSPQSFERFFRRMTGLRPLEFRRSGH